MKRKAKVFILITLNFILVSCLSQLENTGPANQLTAEEKAEKAIQEWEKNRESFNSLDYTPGHFFFQGFQHFINLIEPEFFFDGSMQSNQNKIDQSDSINYIHYHFGRNRENRELEVKKRIKAFFEGKETARAYLVYLKTLASNKKQFLKSVKELRTSLKQFE